MKLIRKLKALNISPKINNGQVQMNLSTKLSIDRLRKRSEFAAMRKGARQHNSLFVLQCRARTGADSRFFSPDARIGFTVTKKNGNAVVRNRIKRRLRAAIGISLPLHGRTGHDYVLIAKRAALNARFETIVKELNFALNRVHTRLPTASKQAGNQNGQ